MIIYRLIVSLVMVIVALVCMTLIFLSMKLRLEGKIEEAEAKWRTLKYVMIANYILLGMQISNLVYQFLN